MDMHEHVDADLLEELASRLTRAYPEVIPGQLTRPLEQTIREGLSTSAELGFTSPEDIYRFLALRFELSPRQRSSAFFRGVIGRVLSLEAWGPQQRLDFLYRHVVPRAVPADEAALASLFTAKGP